MRPANPDPLAILNDMMSPKVRSPEDAGRAPKMS